MKKMKKATAVVLAILFLSSATAAVFAADIDFGSSALEKNKTYTLSEMLTYAIQDEYLAYAEYEEIIGAFGSIRPFTNIIKAEATHISELEPILENHGVTVPKNTADEYTAVPGTLIDAYQAGLDAEVKNIAMYEAFLKQDLPEDVKAAFTLLKNASEHHLAAFERSVGRSDDSNVSRAENRSNYGGKGIRGAGAGMGDGYGSMNGNHRGGGQSCFVNLP